MASALLSFGDLTDLPGLSTLLTDPGGASLPEQLFRTYGNAAIPYLERALSGTPGRFTAQSIARQLIAVDDPAGFLYDDGIAAFAWKRAMAAQ